MTSSPGYVESVLCEVIEGGITVASTSMNMAGSTYTFTYTASSSGATIKYSYILTPNPGPPPPPPMTPYIFNIDNAIVTSLDTNITSETVCVGRGGYRYGLASLSSAKPRFNGKEKDVDEEGMGGGGTTYDYGFRIYNPSLGRFLSVDPLTDSYPWYTPYQFAGNTPIRAIDMDGLDEAIVTYYKINNKTKVRVQFVDSKDRKEGRQSGFDYINQLTNPSNTTAVVYANMAMFSPQYMLYNLKKVEYYLQSETGSYTGADGKKYEKKTGTLKEAFGNFRTIPTLNSDGKPSYTYYRLFSSEIFKSLDTFYKNDKYGLSNEGLNTDLIDFNQIKSQLNEIGKLMQSNSSLELNKVGFTDKDASNEDNEKLAQNRIDQVKNYLKTNFKLDESRFNTSNQGESNSDQNDKDSKDENLN